MASPRAVGRSGCPPLARESCGEQGDLGINGRGLNTGSREAWLLQRARASVAFGRVSNLTTGDTGPCPQAGPSIQ